MRVPRCCHPAALLPPRRKCSKDSNRSHKFDKWKNKFLGRRAASVVGQDLEPRCLLPSSSLATSISTELRDRDPTMPRFQVSWAQRLGKHLVCLTSHDVSSSSVRKGAVLSFSILLTSFLPVPSGGPAPGAHSSERGCGGCRGGRSSLHLEQLRSRKIMRLRGFFL
ncbi:hypothetical protein E2562_039463 [Oryza meyeriana var. granulata]|uniref:Uncharacterized protein n=1 Tax=Oryza meyeriana var. granulata TaxID=110450 RepID=A0A6G1FHC2_9ORYZ|nr:hypothetical protein E2562_039463 [Oryza meyeriana var. granulata]